MLHVQTSPLSKLSVIFVIIVVVFLTPLFYFNYNSDSKFGSRSCSLARIDVSREGIKTIESRYPTSEEIAVQEDSNIVNIIRKFYLFPPSTEEYNLKNPLKNSSGGQSDVVLKILENKKNGFFVECGGYDGEFESNTLYMERFLGWKGILIEAGKSNFKELQKRNRKAWISNTCMSVKPIPEMVRFYEDNTMGHIVQSPRKISSKNPTPYYVQCFPFYSYLLALNVTTVDYFSLDIEGLEINVLNTIPFDKVFIKVISIEDRREKKQKEITKYMEERGYVFVKKVRLRGGIRSLSDYVYKHPSLV